MSIIAPAISRWSGPCAGTSPHSRSEVSSSAADGSGGFGSDALSTLSSASSRSISGPSSLTRALDRLHLGDRLRGVRPGALGVADRLRRRRCAWPGPLRTPAAARSAARAPRAPAAAARRSRRRGAPTRPAQAPDPGRSPSGRACAYPAGGQSERRVAPGGSCTSEPENFARNLASSTACGPVDDVLRHRAGREAAVADGVQRAVLGSPCAGRSSGRPCTHGSARWSRSPAYPPR